VKNMGILLTIIIVALLGKSIYNQVNKPSMSAKASRLQCQKDATTFERVLLKDKVEDLKNSIYSNSIKIDIQTQKARYMQSELFDYVDPSKIKTQLRSIIKSNFDKSKTTKQDVVLEVLIYENDKKDPGKKTKKSKLYAGYLVFDFKIQHATVYKIQIDFMDLKGADIEKRLSCAIKSALTL
jgi:hypothetical protein